MTEVIIDGIQTVYLWTMDHLLVINMFLALLIIFFQRREPRTVWTWLLVLYFIPILGFVLYLLLGQHFRTNKMFKLKDIEGEVQYHQISELHYM